MIRNIIFDIGNVLTDFRWKEYLVDKGFDGAMIKRIAKASVESPLWAEFDRGTWKDEDMLAAFIANDPEIERELHLAYDDIRGMVTPREYAIPWIRALKEKGYRVLYLSNFSLKAERECAEALDFMPYMDGGILSYREKLIKPEPEIYRLLLERYGLKAEESLFIDDTPVNVEAAGKLGIHALLFQSREQVLDGMRELGVDI